MRRRLSSFVMLFATALLLSSSVLKAAHVNEKAPAFELKDLTGVKVAYKGSGVITIVNFWATWCAPCASEFPELNKLAADYKGKVHVIAIALDEEHAKAKVEAFLKKRSPGNVAVTVLLDEESKSAEAYDVSAMPTSFIVDAKGVVRFKHTGYEPNDANAWRKEIDSL